MYIRSCLFQSKSSWTTMRPQGYSWRFTPSNHFRANDLDTWHFPMTNRIMVKIHPLARCSHGLLNNQLTLIDMAAKVEWVRFLGVENTQNSVLIISHTLHKSLTNRTTTEDRSMIVLVEREMPYYLTIVRLALLINNSIAITIIELFNTTL